MMKCCLPSSTIEYNYWQTIITVKVPVNEHIENKSFLAAEFMATSNPFTFVINKVIQ